MEKANKFSLTVISIKGTMKTENPKVEVSTSGKTVVLLLAALEED